MKVLCEWSLLVVDERGIYVLHYYKVEGGNGLGMDKVTKLVKDSVNGI